METRWNVFLNLQDLGNQADLCNVVEKFVMDPAPHGESVPSSVNDTSEQSEIARETADPVLFDELMKSEKPDEMLLRTRCGKVDDAVMGAVSAPMLCESMDARASQDGEQIDDGVPIDQHMENRGENIPDIILLYHTLVRDGALPSGYEREFASLGPTLKEGAERQCRRDAQISNEEAAVLFHDFHRQRNKAAAAQKSAEEQFLAAARDKPRSYRTR